MAAGHATLVFVTGGQQGRQVAISGREVLVGRAIECQVQLTEDFVSRQHMKFVPTYEGWMVEGLSPSGTHVNGKRYKAGTQVLLDTGDVVGIGKEIEMLFVAPGDEPAAALEAHRQEHPLPEPPAPPPVEPPPLPEAADAPQPPGPPKKEAPAPVEAAKEVAPSGKLKKYLIAAGIYAGVLAAVVIVLLTQCNRKNKDPGGARPKVLAAQEIEAILSEPLPPPEASATASAAIQDALTLFSNRASRAGDRYRCLKAFNQYQAYQRVHDKALEWEDSQRQQQVLAEVISEVSKAYDAAAFYEEAQRWDESRRAWEKAFQLLPESDNLSLVYTRLLQNVIDHLAYVSFKIKPRQAW